MKLATIPLTFYQKTRFGKMGGPSLPKTSVLSNCKWWPFLFLYVSPESTVIGSQEDAH